jgi:UDP-glucose 4-epimerase
MKQKQTILVTGGAGYIGSHTIVELLRQEKYEVISVDNHSNSSPDIYRRIALIAGREVQHYAIDLCDKAATFQLFKKHPEITGIIHFAAFKSVPESVAEPLKYYDNNLNSLLHVLEAASVAGTHKIIFSSSCSVYGNIEQLPVTEKSAFQRAESPYAYTKVAGERIVADYIQANPDKKAISLRYFNPVGAHPSGLIGEWPINKPTSLVPIITQNAIGKLKSFSIHGTDYNTRDGSCIRDYVHVSDIGRAHVLALAHLDDMHLPYDVFNLGTGKGVSVFEALSAFQKASGIKLQPILGPRRSGDVEAIYSDCEKVYAALKWKAEISLEEMMASAWKWEQAISQQKL